MSCTDSPPRRWQLRLEFLRSPIHLQRVLKNSSASADNTPMGAVIQFPNCREISPEICRRISERTKEASYWVRRWSEIHNSLYAADPDDVNEVLLEDSSLYLDGWLYDRNRAAIKARGF